MDAVEECAGSSLLNEAVIKQCLDNESIVIPDSSLPLLPSDWFDVRLLWRDSAIMRYDARCVIWQYQDHYLLTVTQMDIQQIEEFYNVASLCRSTLGFFLLDG